MAHKKHSAPVPPGNQQHGGPANSSAQTVPPDQTQGEVGSAQEQDPKRTIGDFTGKAEHSFQQPGGKNDANH